MPKKQHPEEQIIAALRQHEAGDRTADICRKLGVSQTTFRDDRPMRSLSASRVWAEVYRAEVVGLI